MFIALLRALERPLAFNHERVFLFVYGYIYLAALGPEVALLVVKLKRQFLAIGFDDSVFALLRERWIAFEVEAATVECPFQKPSVAAVLSGQTPHALYEILMRLPNGRRMRQSGREENQRDCNKGKVSFHRTLSSTEIFTTCRTLDPEPLSSR